MVKKAPGVRFSSDETRKPLLLAAALREDGSLHERIRKHSEEDQSKLLLLCQHYGIKSDPPFVFYELALALARELYPETKKRGRKSKWTHLNQGALVVEVGRLVRPNDKLKGIEWAVKRLANQEPWKSFLEVKEGATTSPDPAEALRQIYYKFKDDKWANVMRDAFKMYEHEGQLAEWEKQIDDYVKNPNPK